MRKPEIVTKQMGLDLGSETVEDREKRLKASIAKKKETNTLLTEEELKFFLLMEARDTSEDNPRGPGWGKK